MENNLNKKNNSISKFEKLYNLFNDNKINIIPSREISSTKKTSKQKSIKSTNNKKQKKVSKEKIQKRVNDELINGNNNSQLEKNNKCIGPCYPANSIYYHPISLQVIKSKYNSCPIKSIMVGDTKKIHDECELDNNFDYENYDIFADIFHLASNDKLFLEQIYNINNISDANMFLDNNMNELPILSQKRIINSIYRVYRDNDLFPNDKFIEFVENILKYKYNLEVKTNKILNKIMKNKHKKLWDNLFEKLNE